MNKAVKLLKYVAFLLIGILLMHLAFKNADISKLITQLKEVEFIWVFLSILFGFLAIISRGLRWVYLLNGIGYNAKKSNSIFAVSIGYFTNIAVPRAGEITRCTSLNQTEKIPVDKLFGTIILERAIDFLFLISLLIITFILKFNLFLAFLQKLIDFESINISKLLSVFIIIIVALIILFFLSKKLIRKSSYYKKVSNFLKGVKDGLLSISKLQDKRSFWFHTFVIWIMYLLMTYICFFAIDKLSVLNLVDGLYTMVIGGLGMVAPVQGGIGAYHYVVTLGLMELGIDYDSSLLFATIVHTAQTLMTLAFGGVSLLIVFLQKRKTN
ncbi:MAG: lysylphosphatidylglycerol synthase transmembrane domain-containing protein [Flavobacteriales bacterium]